jgi:hypothetical protein
MIPFKSWSDFLYSTAEERREDIGIYVDTDDITIELPDGSLVEVTGKEGQCPQTALVAVLREFGFDAEFG